MKDSGKVLFTRGLVGIELSAVIYQFGYLSRLNLHQDKREQFLFDEISHLERSLAHGYLDVGITPSYASSETVDTSMSPIAYMNTLLEIKGVAL